MFPVDTGLDFAPDLDIATACRGPIYRAQGHEPQRCACLFFDIAAVINTGLDFVPG